MKARKRDVRAVAANNKVTARVVTITPEQAFEYLKSIDKGSDTVKHQRSIDTNTVDQYARLMSEGKWRLNGETIIIDTNNFLINGQHRLRAVIKSGVPLTVVLVENVQPQSIETIDQGKGRSSTDLLVMTGYSQAEAVMLSTMARNEICQRRYGNPYLREKRRLPKAVEVKKMVESDTLLLESAVWILGFSQRNLPIPAGQIGFLHKRFRQVTGDPALVDDWFTGLATGMNLKDDDPRFWIREKIDIERTEVYNTRSEYKCSWVICAFFKHWKRIDIGLKKDFFSTILTLTQLENLRLPTDD